MINSLEFLSSLTDETLMRIVRETNNLDVLKYLAIHSSTNIKKIVASKAIIASDEGKELREIFMKDSDKCVRKSLASNVFLSPEVLEIMLKDKNLEVLVEACKNPNTSCKALEKILDKTRNVDVYIAMAINPNISTDFLTALYAMHFRLDDSDKHEAFKIEYLKECIAASPVLTESVVAFALADDKSLSVRKKLIENKVANKIQGLLNYMTMDDNELIAKIATEKLKVLS